MSKPAVGIAVLVLATLLSSVALGKGGGATEEGMAAAMVMVAATTVCAVRISVAGATCAAGPPFPVRLRCKARAAAMRETPSRALVHCDMRAH